MGLETQGWERPRSRRAVTWVALVAAAVAVAAAVGALLGRSDGGGLTVTPATPSETVAPAPTPEAEPPAPAMGAWDRRSPAPLVVRAGHSATWTGEEVVVWGGRWRAGHLEDGAAYHPGRDTWRRIADTPLRGRTDHAAVWTGEELLVWGGRRSDDFGPLALSDGAAYDPSTDRWRVLPEAPIDGRWSPTAVWTGDELLVWGGRAQQLRAVYLGDGAAYDPAEDAWRRLPAPPSRARWSPAAAWTGEALLVWGTVSPQRTTTSGIAYRPAADEWRHLGAAPLAVAVPAVAAWVGGEAVVFTPDETLAYDLGDDVWSRFSAVPVAVRSTTRAIPVADGVVVLDGHTGQAAMAAGGGRVLTLEGTGGAPGQPATGLRFTGVGTGTSLIVLGGDDGDRLATWVWSPAG